MKRLAYLRLNVRDYAQACHLVDQIGPKNLAVGKDRAVLRRQTSLFKRLQHSVRRLISDRVDLYKRYLVNLMLLSDMI